MLRSEARAPARFPKWLRCSFLAKQDQPDFHACFHTWNESVHRSSILTLGPHTLHPHIVLGIYIGDLVIAMFTTHRLPVLLESSNDELPTPVH